MQILLSWAKFKSSQLLAWALPEFSSNKWRRCGGKPSHYLTYITYTSYVERICFPHYVVVRESSSASFLKFCRSAFQKFSRIKYKTSILTYEFYLVANRAHVSPTTVNFEFVSLWLVINIVHNQAALFVRWSLCLRTPNVIIQDGVQEIQTINGKCLRNFAVHFSVYLEPRGHLEEKPYKVILPYRIA